MPEAEAREPLQHWHSAPYATLEGYRLECDAQRMMATGATHGYASIKGELGQCDPLSQLQASASSGSRHLAARFRRPDV